MVEVQARTSLWYLVFFGFAVNYMIRINLNITIVDMVKNRKSSISDQKGRLKECSSNANYNHEQLIALDVVAVAAASTNHHNSSDDWKNSSVSVHASSNSSRNSENIKINSSLTTIMISTTTEVSPELFQKQLRSSLLTTQLNDSINLAIIINNNKSGGSSVSDGGIISSIRSFSLERKFLQKFQVEYEENGFNWNEYEQGLVLGSFFWLHWLTQIPGGILAKKYGTKLIYGLANALGCWICFLLPIVSYWDYRILILLRVIQGLICGLAWPAMHHMTAQWIPPNERSKFVTAYLGSSIGIAVFYPLFGYIMSWTSWEWVYHVCGVIGTIWYIAWLLMAFDTPAKHPRISDKERKYIEKSLGVSVQPKNIGPTPWKEILTSKPVWMNVIAQWGGIWGLFTLMTQAPTYFKIIHGWNIKMTGILSGIPHLMRMIFAYFFSSLGDYLLKTEKMSRTNVRKMATTMCCIVKGIFVLALAYSGCDSTAAIIFLTLSTAVHGAVSTGPLASIVDIAPNYAGIILGISGMIGVLPGFISPVIVGLLTYQNQTITSWKYVFLITSAMLIVCGTLYVIACESNTQSWNNNRTKKEVCFDKELQLIGSNDDVVCRLDKNNEKVIKDSTQEEEEHCKPLMSVEKS